MPTAGIFIAFKQLNFKN